MHTLVEVDGIEDFNSIPLLQKCIATFKNHASLWISYYKRTRVILTVALQQVWFNKKACFT